MLPFHFAATFGRFDANKQSGIKLSAVRDNISSVRILCKFIVMSTERNGFPEYALQITFNDRVHSAHRQVLTRKIINRRYKSVYYIVYVSSARNKN